MTTPTNSPVINKKDTTNRCCVRKKDGTRCSNLIPDYEKYCAFHRKKLGRATRHGMTADPRLLGIPNKKVQVFETFMSDPEPLRLNSELAYLRTLMVELREALESNRARRRTRLKQRLARDWREWLIQHGLQDNNADKVTQMLTTTLESALDDYIGPALPLSASEVKDLSDLLEAISRVAERAKKIRDGVTVTVQYGEISNILSTFVREIIFREIKDVATRQRIAQEARRIFGKQQLVLDQQPSRIVDALPEIVSDHL